MLYGSSMKHKPVCIRRLLISLCVIAFLFGCAGSLQAPATRTMYEVSSVIPKTFDLNITPIADNEYLIDGKQETLGNLYWMLRKSVHSAKPINTILFQNNKKSSNMQYLCFLMLVYNRRLAAYYESKGKITAVKITSTSDISFNYFYHQCLDPIISQ